MKKIYILQTDHERVYFSSIKKAFVYLLNMGFVHSVLFETPEEKDFYLFGRIAGLGKIQTRHFPGRYIPLFSNEPLARKILAQDYTLYLKLIENEVTGISYSGQLTWEYLY